MKKSKAIWGTVAALFLIGLVLRIAALDLPPMGAQTPSSASRWRPSEMLPFLENDEKIYIALVEQLDQGKGYTLQGHAILREPWINQQQYDHPLFFHPPGGPVFFWLTYRIWPQTGFAAAQLLSYGIFFWSMMLLAATVFRPLPGLAAVLTAALAAFSPIMTHVVCRFWLDGPLLAFTTLAAAIFLQGVVRQNRTLVCVAGLLLGFSSLIKLTAFLVIPGMAALMVALAPRPHKGASYIGDGSLFWQFVPVVLIAFAVQLPWEIWQWWSVGSAFPSWAGKPATDLVQTNSYVYYVTAWRQPWVYLELLPQVLWTLIPSVLLLALQWKNRETRPKSLALLIWILTIVGAHVVLGFIGYSKVLRYVILVTPAAVLLFVLTTVNLVEAIRAGQILPGGKPLAVTLLFLAAAGMALEITQGIVTPLVDNVDLIRPLPGLRSFDYGQPMTWPPQSTGR